MVIAKVKDTPLYIQIETDDDSFASQHQQPNDKEPLTRKPIHRQQKKSFRKGKTQPVAYLVPTPRNLCIDVPSPSLSLYFSLYTRSLNRRVRTLDEVVLAAEVTALAPRLAAPSSVCVYPYITHACAYLSVLKAAAQECIAMY